MLGTTKITSVTLVTRLSCLWSPFSYSCRLYFLSFVSPSLILPSHCIILMLFKSSLKGITKCHAQFSLPHLGYFQVNEYVCVCVCVCVFYLLNVLLEYTQLQTLVQPDLTVLPDVLQLPLVMQNLMDDVQNMVHCFGVIGRSRQRISAARGQGALKFVQ